MNKSCDYSCRFLVQIERRQDFLAIEDTSYPINLVGRLEKRVVAVNRRVLSLDNILNLPDRFSGHVFHLLNALHGK